MYNTVFLKILIVMLMIIGLSKHSVHADHAVWEDEDLPISFNVEVLPWEKVREIIPNKTKFTIIDVETGLSFHVQRRAGSSHADVQPLTRKDTKIMKKIYHNRWSWKRRAILILSKDHLIAASMNGMPHGAGALPNGFPGHFCVHFSGSSTHKLKKVDPAHQLMILKASGKLEEYFQTVKPDQLVNIFGIAVNQKDQKILELSVVKSKDSKEINKVVKDITAIKTSILSNEAIQDMDSLLVIEIPVKVTIHTKNNDKEKKKIKFIIRRSSLTDRWYIDEGHLYQELSSMIP
jgi:hypothetical protein